MISLGDKIANDVIDRAHRDMRCPEIADLSRAHRDSRMDQVPIFAGPPDLDGSPVHDASASATTRQRSPGLRGRGTSCGTPSTRGAWSTVFPKSL